MVCAPGARAQQYDLLLKGGHLIDPKNGVDAVRDIATKGDAVAAIGENIPASSARRVVDVTGLYVTPGLIDIHTHVFAGTDGSELAGGLTSVIPDHVGFRTAVTTMVDAGSSGWRNFPKLRRTIIEPSRTRVLAFLNIVGIGMVSYDLEQNPTDMDVKLTAEMAMRNKDVIVGIKTAHWRQPNFLAVERAIEAGKLAKLPIMVDFGYFLPERPYRQMISELLRPGDISTHFYRTPAPITTADGKIEPYLLAARKRGVKFDVGHGSGSFHFPAAEPAVRAGFWPDSISTDLHSGSINGGMIDMLSVMSKFLAMGVPLNEVIRRSTSNPAAEINRPELGHLAIGAPADIAVLRLDKGRFGYLDVRGGKIEGTERLGCELTVRAGRIVFDYNGRAGVPWRGSKIQYPTQ